MVDNDDRPRPLLMRDPIVRGLLDTLGIDSKLLRGVDIRMRHDEAVKVTVHRLAGDDEVDEAAAYAVEHMLCTREIVLDFDDPI